MAEVVEIKPENVDVNEEENLSSPYKENKHPTLWNELMKFRHSDEGKAHLITNIFKRTKKGGPNVNKSKNFKEFVSVVWNDRKFTQFLQNEKSPLGKAYHRLAFKIFTAYGCEADSLVGGAWKENGAVLQTAFSKMCAWNGYNALSHFLSNEVSTDITQENSIFKASLIQAEEEKCSATGPTIQSAKHNLAIAFFAEEGRSKKYCEWLTKKRTFTQSCDSAEIETEERKFNQFFDRHHPFGTKKRYDGKIVNKRQNIWRSRVEENDDGKFEAAFFFKQRGEDKNQAAQRIALAWKNICGPKRKQRQQNTKPNQQVQNSEAQQEATKMMQSLANGKSAVMIVNEFASKNSAEVNYTVTPIDSTNKSLGFTCVINYGGRLNVSGMGPDMVQSKKNAAMMLVPMLVNQLTNNRKRKSPTKGKNFNKKKSKTEVSQNAEIDAAAE